MDSPLLLELHEIHEYVRAELAVYFAWFSFFLTILLGAMGWSLKAALDAQGRVRFPIVFFCMVFLFAAQLLMGIGATTNVISDFTTADSRAVALLELVQLEDHADHQQQKYLARSPIPSGFTRSLQLARAALIVNLMFWPLVAVVVFRKWQANEALATYAD